MAWKLPKRIKDSLAKEFRFAAERMADAPALALRLYFFSAFYGELRRVVNYHWDADLALAHAVLSDTYQQMFSASNSSDRIIQVAEIMEHLIPVAIELAEHFEADEVDRNKVRDSLARIAEIGFASTGNGFYLYLKGDIKLED